MESEFIALERTQRNSYICGMKGLFVRCFLLSTIFCFNHINGLSNTDSLMLQLEVANTDEEKHEILLSLADKFKKTEKGEALSYALEAYKYAYNINENQKLWEAAFLVAELYYDNDSMGKALEYSNLALSYIDGSSSALKMAKSYKQMGSLLMHLYDYETAGDYLLKALKIFEQENHTSELANVNNLIGYLYYGLSDIDKAQKYYTRGLDYALQSGDSIQLARALNNLAAVFEAQNKFDKAQEYFNEACQINTLMKLDKKVAMNLLNLGIIQISKVEAVHAFNFFYRSIALATELNDIGLLVKNYIQLSRAHEQLNNADSAYYYAFKAYEISTIEKLIMSQTKAIYRLYSYFELIGIADSANLYGLKFYQLEDSLNWTQQLSTMSNLELQYEFRKQQQEDKFKQERRDLNRIIFIGSLIFTLIIILLLYARLRIRNKHNRLLRLQLEKDLEVRNKELTTGVMYSIQKNKVLSTLTEGLLEIEQKAVKEETRDAIKKISNKIHESVESNAWEEFEVRFQQVHTDFYETLAHNHPDLTQNEKRLCAFLRLDMSSKEISRITGQNISALEVARIRLRKKLGISHTDTNLNAFLSQY